MTTKRREQTMIAAKQFSEPVRDMGPDAFQPVGDRLWVECIPAAEQTKGGLTIPTAARENVNYAVVRAKGDKAFAFSVGDCVMVEAYDGQRINFEGSRSFLLVEVDQIKCKLLLTPQYPQGQNTGG